ncbi:bis(5'-nucleosyl)-tetraphosphatase (symmetrical) YqeK [Treponema sp.]|uniref:bis(5'-nucleosyl)-tetraphosphatase (symmetrical) YqeK n=1 Tax=Treponema sp. TaxID=166 RepID=UPI003F09C0EC
MEEKTELLIGKIRKYAKSALKEKRYEHSVRVAEMAAFLCGLFGCDKDAGYLAGISHDICKNMDDSEILQLASDDGMAVSVVEKAKPSLLHGRAAAVLLQRRFSVSDADVVQAVANHTLGAAGLCPLAKIVYVADKIEPGRPQSTDEYRRNLFSMTLNEMTLFVVRENMEYLNSRQKKIADASYEFEADLKRQIALERNLCAC